jgi:hypothetical protein
MQKWTIMGNYRQCMLPGDFFPRVKINVGYTCMEVSSIRAAARTSQTARSVRTRGWLSGRGWVEPARPASSQARSTPVSHMPTSWRADSRRASSSCSYSRLRTWNRDWGSLCYDTCLTRQNQRNIQSTLAISSWNPEAWMLCNERCTDSVLIFHCVKIVAYSRIDDTSLK